MPDHRPFDLILYGASGFTGQYILEKFVQSEEFGQLNLAIAGRDEKKLQKTLKIVGQWTGTQLAHIPIIVANVWDAQKIDELAKSTKVIINAVGPFSLYGEPIIRAAVENGAHYVDISGEVEWIERMAAKYSELARQNGVFILNGCAYLSMATDLGVLRLKQKFTQNNGKLANVETFYLTNKGPKGYPVNSGSLETMLHWLSSAKAPKEVEEVRKQIMPKEMPKNRWGPPIRSLLFWNDQFQSFCTPMVPDCDGAFIRRSEYSQCSMENDGILPIQSKHYLLLKGEGVNSRFGGIQMFLWMIFIGIFAKFEAGRRFLRANPELCRIGPFRFTEESPSREQTSQTSCILWLLGIGWNLGENQKQEPTKRLAIRMDGPDPGYSATAGFVMATAICLIREKEKLRGEGGVLTTATVLGDTKIFERLEKFGITYKIVDSIGGNNKKE